MPAKINNISELQDYFKGVVARAECHTPHDLDILCKLLGMVIYFNDVGTPLEIRQYDGSPANMIWFHVKGKKITMLYNHTSGEIEIRERSQTGSVLKSIMNTTSTTDLINFFNSL